MRDNTIRRAPHTPDPRKPLATNGKHPSPANKANVQALKQPAGTSKPLHNPLHPPELQFLHTQTRNDTQETP